MARTTLRRNPGTAVALVLAAHPLLAAAVAAGTGVAALVSGRALREVLLVLATVFLGRLTVGWLDDVADRERDIAVERLDRPLVREWLDPGTVTFTVACATLVLVPLSISNGTYAGVAHLLSVAAGWVSVTRIKGTWLSWLPWAVSFGLLPAFLSYGGWGGGVHGGPPTLAVTLLAALLGVAVHVLVTLPDLVGDHRNGLRSLPLIVALKIGAPRLLIVASVLTALLIGGLVAAGLTVGLRQ